MFLAPFELIAACKSASQQVAERLRAAGIPAMLLWPFPNRSDFALISANSVLMGYLVAEHLIKLGCRQIAFGARPNSAPAKLY